MDGRTQYGYKNRTNDDHHHAISTSSLAAVSVAAGTDADATDEAAGTSRYASNSRSRSSAVLGVLGTRAGFPVPVLFAAVSPVARFPEPALAFAGRFRAGLSPAA